MSDLVTRLRDVDEQNALIVRRRAADEIERLEAKIDQLVAERDACAAESKRLLKDSR